MTSSTQLFKASCGLLIAHLKNSYSWSQTDTASWLEACPRYAQNQVLSAQSGQDPGSGYLLRKILGNLAP
jgi:hypothetical protein